MKIDHVSAIVENGAAHVFAVLFNKLSVRLNDHVQPDIAAPCRRDHRNDIAERGQVAFGTPLSSLFPPSAICVAIRAQLACR